MKWVLAFSCSLFLFSSPLSLSLFSCCLLLSIFLYLFLSQVHSVEVKLQSCHVISYLFLSLFSFWHSAFFSVPQSLSCFLSLFLSLSFPLSIYLSLSLSPHPKDKLQCSVVCTLEIQSAAACLPVLYHWASHEADYLLSVPVCVCVRELWLKLETHFFAFVCRAGLTQQALQRDRWRA